jgi:hypothetical protein
MCACSIPFSLLIGRSQGALRKIDIARRRGARARRLRQRLVDAGDDALVPASAARLVHLHANVNRLTPAERRGDPSLPPRRQKRSCKARLLREIFGVA